MQNIHRSRNSPSRHAALACFLSCTVEDPYGWIDYGALGAGFFNGHAMTMTKVSSLLDYTLSAKEVTRNAYTDHVWNTSTFPAKGTLWSTSEDESLHAQCWGLKSFKHKSPVSLSCLKYLPSSCYRTTRENKACTDSRSYQVTILLYVHVSYIHVKHWSLKITLSIHKTITFKKTDDNSGN